MSTVQATSVVEKIQERGYWRVVIRPTTFDPKRIARHEDLFPLVDRLAVRLRGWSYPYVNIAEQPCDGGDWIGQEKDWNHFLEMWKFYQSGQFYHIFGMVQDWRDESSLWPEEDDWRPGRIVDPRDAVAYFTEIFEFAARLAMSKAGDNAMQIEIDLRNIEGRVLPYIQDHADFIQPCQTSAREFVYRRDLTRTELVTDTKSLARQAARELFLRFGWEPSEEVLRVLQETIGR